MKNKDKDRKLKDQELLWRYFGDMSDEITKLKESVNELQTIVIRKDRKAYREHLVKIGLNDEEIEIVLDRRFKGGKKNV